MGGVSVLVLACEEWKEEGRCTKSSCSANHLICLELVPDTWRSSLAVLAAVPGAVPGQKYVHALIHHKKNQAKFQE